MFQLSIALPLQDLIFNYKLVFSFFKGNYTSVLFMYDCLLLCLCLLFLLFMIYDLQSKYEYT